MKETELYQPVKNHLEKLGFLVRAEVRNCDLTATRGKELLIVELKTRFNLDLVLQGIDRQRICSNVFLAVPRPDNMGTRRWRGIVRLCRALGLGLMTVSSRGLVDVVCDPVAQTPRRDSGAHKLLLREIAARSGDYNTGGSSGRPLVTAYREQALLVAQAVDAGLQRPRDIVAATGIARAPSILQKNYYRWFERAERGHYRLSDLGRQALKEYADVLNINNIKK
ncbi:MAG: hypothetical protein GX090_04175 [Firmicutes bacterium]|nr:hypothetical protein [Bacillota bacterium]HOB34190.1 DUF2161 family putative PD-(D/E)XK-type phosphodiesterase [Bacillota bacterium]HPZ90184.1 DUF2161 family putative PD-(D/E)XK-type phosphodiesterase [Bacillota bacterium]HQE01574.1 DUF2161 family putative PD-(D/E)XK-type phosphodiesterase [Bacillota bacterium]